MSANLDWMVGEYSVGAAIEVLRDFCGTNGMSCHKQGDKIVIEKREEKPQESRIELVRFAHKETATGTRISCVYGIVNGNEVFIEKYDPDIVWLKRQDFVGKTVAEARALVKSRLDIEFAVLEG